MYWLCVSDVVYGNEVRNSNAAENTKEGFSQAHDDEGGPVDVLDLFEEDSDDGTQYHIVGKRV